jgi:hypothetical protein
MNRKYLLLILLTLPFPFIFAQKNSDVLEKYFNDARKNESYYIPQNTLKEINSARLLKYVRPFLADDHAFVRYKAIDLVKRKGLLLTDTIERRTYTRTLMEGCKDKDSGNSGAASGGLTLFLRSDFDGNARDSILSLLKQKPFHYDRIIRLAGFLEIKEAGSLLTGLVQNDSTCSQKDRWSAHLALARMGDSTNMEYCLSRVKSVPVNDQSIYALFPDLVYTRQVAAIQYIMDEIMDDAKKCSSPNPNSEEPVICAYGLIELAGPVIENFPLQPDETGEIEIENYEETLAQVRKWINSKPAVRVRREGF